MYCLSPFCCVCLSNSKELLKLTKADTDGVPLLSKMIDVVYGHEKIDLEIARNICTECLLIMRLAFKFKRACIYNTNIVKNYIGQLKYHTGSIGSYGEATLVLIDSNNEKVVKNDIKIEDAPLNSEANILEQAEIIEVKEVTLPETNLPNVSASTSKTKSLHFCNICKKHFVRIKDHMLTHKREAIYNCQYCDRKYTRKDNLRTHMKLHANVNMQVSCYICNEEITGDDNYKKHLNSKHGITQFECIICNQKYSTEANYYMHLQIHQNLTFYHCPVCKKSYPRQDYLDLHVKCHNERKYRLNVETGEFCCLTCQFNFKHRSNFTSHKCENFINPQTCDICGKMFGKHFPLDRHRQSHFVNNKSRPSYAMNTRPFQGSNYTEPSSSYNPLIPEITIKEEILENFCSNSLYMSDTFTRNVRSQPEQMANNVNHQQIVTEQLSETNPNIRQQLQIPATTNLTETNLNIQSPHQITYDLSKTTFVPITPIVNNIESIVISDPLDVFGEDKNSNMEVDPLIDPSNFCQQQIETGEFEFPCHLCSKKFAMESLLKAHLVIHSVPCPICNIVCLTQSDYDVHVHMHCRADKKPSLYCRSCKSVYERYKLKY